MTEAAAHQWLPASSKTRHGFGEDASNSFATGWFGLSASALPNGLLIQQKLAASLQVVGVLTLARANNTPSTRLLRINTA
jgi:hypothetical protein